MISTLMKISNTQEQQFGWVNKEPRVPTHTLVSWRSQTQYLWVARISLGNIIAFREYLENKYGGQIPYEELVALSRDLKNHIELFGVGSELYKRNMELKQ